MISLIFPHSVKMIRGIWRLKLLGYNYNVGAKGQQREAPRNYDASLVS
jgi:hypothetical protein